MKNLFSTNSLKALMADEQGRKKVIKIGAIGLIIIIALIFFIGTKISNSSEPQPLNGTNDISLSDSTENQKATEIEKPLEPKEASYIYVDIGGAVVTPSLVCIKKGSRLDDAIKEAGGLLPDASTKTINRAQKLKDGEKIYIPSLAEESFNESQGQGDGTQATADKGIDAEGKVNLNLATNDELQTLTGVGPATALKIIEYREANGGYKKIEDLKNVSGIGEKTFAKLKDKIFV
jgi:competence protein ComEA